MANQRLIFLVCLVSITLFSFNCAGLPTHNDTSSVPSHLKEEPQSTSTNSSTSVDPITTTKGPDTTTKPTPKPTDPPKPTPTTTPSPPPPTSPITSTISPPTSSSKPSPSPSSTTSIPSTTTSAPSKHDRAFDLPSFIGGVILALGLAAIGYVVYKFYKTRTDPNYRSL